MDWIENVLLGLSIGLCAVGLAAALAMLTYEAWCWILRRQREGMQDEDCIGAEASHSVRPMPEEQQKPELMR